MFALRVGAMAITLAAVSSVGAASSPVRTPGCGSPPPDRVGGSTEKTFTFEGVERKYIIRVPPGYKQNEPAPVVFSFHGWGERASFNEKYMGLNEPADAYGHIVIYPEGRSDYQRETNNGWQSWNSVGSTTTLGDECTKSTTGYCYNSCAKRPQKCGRCDWTSCSDDGKFVEAIIDLIEEKYCIDQTRYYATGYSNGGGMAYEVGISVLSKFAAIVPGGGQAFVGHNNPPPTGKGGLISVMDLHGTTDRVCPANTTTSSGGWNYEPVDNIMKVWATANGCSAVNKLQKFKTQEDGNTGLWCVSFGDCPKGVDIVRCSYNMGHNWLGYNTNGGAGARLAFEFFRNHHKISADETRLRIVSSVQQ